MFIGAYKRRVVPHPVRRRGKVIGCAARQRNQVYTSELLRVPSASSVVTVCCSPQSHRLSTLPDTAVDLRIFFVYIFADYTSLVSAADENGQSRLRRCCRR